MNLTDLIFSSADVIKDMFMSELLCGPSFTKLHRLIHKEI